MGYHPACSGTQKKGKQLKATDLVANAHRHADDLVPAPMISEQLETKLHAEAMIGWSHGHQQTKRAGNLVATRHADQWLTEEAMIGWSPGHQHAKRHAASVVAQLRRGNLLAQRGAAEPMIDRYPHRPIRNEILHGSSKHRPHVSLHVDAAARTS